MQASHYITESKEHAIKGLTPQRFWAIFLSTFEKESTSADNIYINAFQLHRLILYENLFHYLLGSPPYNYFFYFFWNKDFSYLKISLLLFYSII